MRDFEHSNATFLGLLKPARAPVTEEEQAVAIAQQSSYIDMTGMMSSVNLINGTVVTISLAWIVDLRILLPWYLLLCVFTFLGWSLWRRTRQTEAPKTTEGQFLRKAEWSAMLLGFVWGIPNVIFSFGDLSLTMFFMLVSASTAAGFVSMASALPRVTSRFVGAAALPIITNALVGLQEYGFVVASLALVLVYGLVQGSMRSYQQLSNYVTSRLEANQARRDLLDAIEAVDDAFAIHDTAGRTTVSNARFRQWFPKGIDLNEDSDTDVQRISDRTWVLRSMKATTDGRKVSIHKDVTSLKLREQQLIAARREAEDANEAKARFMATMSHELRTPLNIIIGFSSIMSSRSNIEVTPGEMREHADSIHDAGKHLLNVIDDIIEYSQVGSDRYIHAPEAHDPRELMSQAISLSTKFLDPQERQGIELVAASNLGQIIVDEGAFRRVLIGLVSNAIKFGGRPVHVHVRAYLGPNGEPMISVRDFGPGISPNDLERVFEPFYQCEADRGGEFTGTGLGLALARQIARMHGGDVRLASRPGAGTTATIILPASSHIPPAANVVEFASYNDNAA